MKGKAKVALTFLSLGLSPFALGFPWHRPRITPGIIMIYGAGVPAGVRPHDVEDLGHVFLLIPCEKEEQECVTLR